MCGNTGKRKLYARSCSHIEWLNLLGTNQSCRNTPSEIPAARHNLKRWRWEKKEKKGGRLSNAGCQGQRSWQNEKMQGTGGISTNHCHQRPSRFRARLLRVSDPSIRLEGHAHSFYGRGIGPSPMRSEMSFPDIPCPRIPRICSRFSPFSLFLFSPPLACCLSFMLP